jgi:hypothetical protein
VLLPLWFYAKYYKTPIENKNQTKEIEFSRRQLFFRKLVVVVVCVCVGGGRLIKKTQQ